MVQKPFKIIYLLMTAYLYKVYQNYLYMKFRTIFAVVFAYLFSFYSCAQGVRNPIFNYSVEHMKNKQQVKGSYRILELNGRKGINPTSIHTRLQYPKHNLNHEKGSLSYWVFSLEELSAFKKRDVMFNEENLNTWTYSFLCDIPNIGDYDNSAFNLAFYTGWHPSLIAKFYKGNVFTDAIRPPKKAYAMASAFEMHKNTWYQFTITWDMPKKQINVYANGVLIATADSFTPDFVKSDIGDILYSGKPLMCFGELNMYTDVMSETQVKALFEKESTSIDKELQTSLRHIHAGENLKTFDWRPTKNKDWQLNWDVPMTDDNTLENFYLQGVVDTIKVTSEGTQIQTRKIAYRSSVRDQQMYLWSKKEFEGDIYVEYEFKTNQEFGLSLLMLQATGTSRENFKQDYKPRTTGVMSWVHSSDIRNYHIEYYRKMNAVRNDNSNIAMIKNPYEYPMGYGTLDENYEVGKWYKMQVLQHGNTFTCAINGKIVFEAEDKEFANNGPVLTSGRIALRCMVNTDMHFKNLKIYTKKLPYEIVD